MLKYFTAGDSHGAALMGILEGFPAHVPISENRINQILARRQGGYGRGVRMQMEYDQVRLISGIWRGKSSGAPIGLLIHNKSMHDAATVPPRTVPRPGHADLAGAWKYGFEDDFNPIIERASARETAMRVAIGAICQMLLAECQIEVVGHVRQIGSIQAPKLNLPTDELRRLIMQSPVYCADPITSERMVQLVDNAQKTGDTLGGSFEVITFNTPPGLGSHVHYESRLDARLALHLMSIPSVKAVEIGEGVKGSQQPGSQMHDAILVDSGTVVRGSNRAGGIEGGISNGQPIVVRAYLKPIPTLRQPLPSVDLATGVRTPAPYIRSDVMVVPAAAVVGEAVVAFVIAQALLEKFGSDTLPEIQEHLKFYRNKMKNRFPS
ncbi:chorismate synthase [candidate division KSB1 bacterium]|nr:MAG: chorismate synthase [candidate division KSB1 bacterium]RKY89801.1 MAG: chorismate synthase [candidate division KSB1 bacterium]